MQHFAPEERGNLSSSVIGFHNEWVEDRIHGPLVAGLRLTPASLQMIIEDLQTLRQVLQSTGDVDSRLLPLLKRAVIWARREKAASVEARGSLALSVEVLDRLQLELAPFSTTMGQDWFKETTALSSPRLTDYLTISHAEEIARRRGGLEREARVYDEKFHILLAPTLFLSDLAYFRARCDLRSQSVSVAFVDIDKFKNVNDCYGHERVDRDILPRFMGVMEAHVFSRGFAYRNGGDEYLVLLPNMSRDHTIPFLSEFQSKLKAVNYFQIDKNPTVSIGVCEIGPDGILTDSEVREKADEAHEFAKQAGRNLIATFTDDTYEELEVAELTSPPGQ